VPHNISTILTPRALAYWYMDDGTTDINFVSVKKLYVISTQGFCRSDQELVVNALKAVCGIDASVHVDKTYFRLYIQARCNDTFLNRIRPYVHSDFAYKL
jgi:LAGLIDADG DNA endonuclease family